LQEELVSRDKSGHVGDRPIHNDRFISSIRVGNNSTTIWDQDQDHDFVCGLRISWDGLLTFIILVFLGSGRQCVVSPLLWQIWLCPFALSFSR